MINIKVTGVREQLLRLDPLKVRKAAARALNRVGRKGVTASRREITRQYTIKQKDIKQNIKLSRKATASRLQATLSADGGRIRLIKFQTRVRKISAKGRKAGKLSVRVRVKRGGGLKPLKSAFPLTWSPGRTGIGERIGMASRIPTRELFGPSVPQMFRSQGVMTALEERVSQEFPKEFDHELEWEMKKGR